MEIFNIGIPELIIILILMFILLGPGGMVQTSQKIGQTVRKIVHSPWWREITGYSQEIRELPQKFMDESGLRDTMDEVRESTQGAAADLKEAVKQVNDAARIPAEEFRIQTGAEDARSIAGDHSIAGAHSTAGDHGSAADISPDLAAAALVEYSPPEKQADLDGGTQPDDTPPLAEQGEPVDEVKPVKKPRKPRAPKKDAPAVDDNGIPIDSGTVIAYPVPDNGDVKPRRARKPRAEVSSAETEAGAEESSQSPQDTDAA